MYRRAFSCVAMSCCANSLRRLERAVAATPRRSTYRHALGTVLYRIGKIDASVPHLNEAIALPAPVGAPRSQAVGSGA